MGVSLVFRERVSETLGNRCCFRMFLFLIPVSVRIPPPPTSFLSLTVTQKKKSRQKKILFPRHKSRATRGWGMTMYSLCMRHLRLLSNTQRTVCLCVSVSVSLSVLPWLPTFFFLCVHTVIHGGQGYLKVIDDWDAYCHVNYRHTCDKRFQAHLARGVGDHICKYLTPRT